MTQRTTSVIIVSYHTGPALWICLRRLLQLHGVGEILVVNNGNSGSVEKRLNEISAALPQVKIFSGHGNIGFAAACNLGVAHATGHYVLFLNPDAMFMEDDAILRMTSLFEQPDMVPPVGMVGAILRNDDGSEQRASRRNWMTPANALAEGLGLTCFLPNLPRINLDGSPIPDASFTVPAASGACMMMERDRHVEIGGFDDDYFLHVEDMDLCRRIYLAGGSIWMRPDVNVLHYRSTSEVTSLFVERHKTHGFYRYFNTHAARSYFLRPLALAAAWMKLSLKIIASFVEEARPLRQMNEADGIRRIQSIIRGANIMQEEGAPILPAGTAVLVTGASTPVGLFTLGRLLAQGCKVVAIKHKTMVGFFDPRIMWLDGDFEKIDELTAKLRHFPCQYAIHCAPVWHLPKILPALSALGIRHISAVSSTSLLSKEQSTDPKERATAQSLAESEATASRIASGAGVGLTIIRPTMIYGAGLDQNVTRMASVIDKTRRFFIQAPAMGKRAPVHADDVAKAALLALVKPEANGKIYHLSGSTVLPFCQMPQAIADVLGQYVRVSAIPGLASLCALLHPLLPKRIPHPEVALRMQRDLVFHDPNVQQDLGFTPRSFLAGDIADLGVCSEMTCRALIPVPTGA